MSPCKGSCQDGAGVCPSPSCDTGDTPYWEHSNASGSPQLSGLNAGTDEEQLSPSPLLDQAATRRSHQEERPLWPSALGQRLEGIPSKPVRSQGCTGCRAVQHQHDGNGGVTDMKMLQ